MSNVYECIHVRTHLCILLSLSFIALMRHQASNIHIQNETNISTPVKICKSSNTDGIREHITQRLFDNNFWHNYDTNASVLYVNITLTLFSTPCLRYVPSVQYYQSLLKAIYYRFKFFNPTGFCTLIRIVFLCTVPVTWLRHKIHFCLAADKPAACADIVLRPLWPYTTASNMFLRTIVILVTSI